LLAVLDETEVQAAGLMHTPADTIGDAIAILRQRYNGPLMAYPDSGHMKMPEWQFQDIIAVEDFRDFADNWVADGVQILGGCCGLTLDHMRALAAFKGRKAGRAT